MYEKNFKVVKKNFLLIKFLKFGKRQVDIELLLNLNIVFMKRLCIDLCKLIQFKFLDTS